MQPVEQDPGLAGQFADIGLVRAAAEKDRIKRMQPVELYVIGMDQGPGDEGRNRRQGVPFAGREVLIAHHQKVGAPAQDRIHMLRCRTPPACPQ